MKKSVMIVGATGGIGLGLVERFARGGYDIVATYNKSKINEVENICKRYSAKLLSMKMDISIFEDVEKGFEQAFKESDYLDCVVVNSGISVGESLLCDMIVEDIDKTIDVNLKGAIYCNREAQKHFIKQKHGNIVNISSIYGIYGGCCESAYSASKGGIISLTKALADECGCFGVRVNAVAPGCIETKMTEDYLKTQREELENNSPLKRIGKPIDVANAVYFLASEDASFITGEVLTVSGGASKF